MEGSVDLYYRSKEEYHPKNIKKLSVEEINPGKVIAISALIEPNKLSTTARVAQNSYIIKVDAMQLKMKYQQDQEANKCLKKIVNNLLEGLMSLRVQLAASQN